MTLSTPRLRLLEAHLSERPMTFRMAFRFGATTLTSAPQAFVRVRIALEDGHEAWGQAAELMVPKWFDKNPELSNEDNFEQLRTAIRLAAGIYHTHGMDTAFGLAMRSRAAVAEAGVAAGLDGLVGGFGPALLDRAILDALCRLYDTSFARAMQANLPGMTPDLMPADMRNFAIEPFLASRKPGNAIALRHTVGLADPLTADEADRAGLVKDGLPRSLDEVIAAYRPGYFKIKLCGERETDVARISAIAAMLDGHLKSYHVTLDGNEQFASVEQLQATLAAFDAEPRLNRFMRAILFIEQPIKRAAALSESVSDLKSGIPLLIDESDGEMDAFLQARAVGYQGVSSKDCKGFYRSIVNAARCEAWNDAGNDAGPGTRYFLSGEDLTCPSGLAVQQDLALVAFLGLTHVERNGHHYFAGMAGAPRDETAAFLQAHGDLYEDFAGGARLKIREGRIELKSIQQAGFGSAVAPDLSDLTPVSLISPPG